MKIVLSMLGMVLAGIVVMAGLWYLGTTDIDRAVSATNMNKVAENQVCDKPVATNLSEGPVRVSVSLSPVVK